MGGVRVHPRGQLELSYSWSLGKTSNNMVKVYSHLQGMSHVVYLQIHKLIILGDSSVIIHHLHLGSSLLALKLNAIFENVHSSLVSLVEFQAKHIL